MDSTELDILLGTLARHGVTSAEFGADGRLCRVEMVPPALVGAVEDVGNDLAKGEPVTPVDAAARRMLGREKRAEA